MGDIGSGKTVGTHGLRDLNPLLLSRVQALLFIWIAGLVYILTACQATSSPSSLTVLLSVTGDLSAFTGLTIYLADVRLHRADQPRDAGWYSLPPLMQEVNLVVGQKIRIAEGVLPGATYDRVWVVVTSAEGALRRGRRMVLEAIVEPIALLPPLAAGRSGTVQITLVVLERAQPPMGRYVVFTQDARWVRPIESR